ncbi:MAG: hypothetical protein WC895_05085, partial [Candidatus Shapirobacteria bacterium]
VFLPYAWNLWQVVHHPFYAETAMRLGVIDRRYAVVGIAVIAFALLPLIFRKRLGPMVWPVTALVLASIIALNQQLVTGKALVPSHYHWYFVKPLSAILGTILIGSWISDRWTPVIARRIRFSIIACVMIIPFIVSGVLFQYRSYQRVLPYWRTEQKTVGAIRYLRNHAHPGDVVYAEGDIRDLIPIYTSADMAIAMHANEFLSSDERSEDMYFFDLWMKGVTPEEASNTFPTTRRAELSGRIHGIYYREASGAYANIPDAQVADAIREYAAFVPNAPENILKKYPMKFVVIAHDDPQTSALADIRSRSDVRFADDAFEVREMRP